jgi:pSer/pThr/pTyr-binding forkhead associated (FHA) protein
MVISDVRVSRSHVRLSLVPEGIDLEDLGSRNGTYYLGQRVKRIVLAPGSRIALGAVEIALDIDAETFQPSRTTPNRATTDWWAPRARCASCSRRSLGSRVR